MSSRRIYIVLVIVAVAVITLALVLRIGRPSPSVAPSDNEQYEGLAVEILPDSVTELSLEFGRVHHPSLVSKSVRIYNRTSETLALLSCDATCRCVWADLPNGAIEPNGYVDVRVWFDSKGEYGYIGNFARIHTSMKSSNIALWIDAEVE